MTVSILTPGAVVTTDADLIAAAQSDPVAFGALYERYARRIQRYLRLRCGNEEDAHDLTQEVFERALAALPRYRDRGLPFSAWLFSIARNRSADAARRARRGGWLVPFDDSPTTIGHQDHAPGPEDVALLREGLQGLARAVAGLRPDQRELLELRFGAGLTAREIAPVVGRSDSAVQKQIIRILHSLKEQIDER